MKKQVEPAQSFKDFKDSFSYGKRGDLNFKFLSHLSEEQAANFFEKLLKKLGNTLNDGNWNRIIRHVIDGQILGYSEPAKFTYDSGPFTRLSKTVSSSKVALLTSSGHFVDGDDPKPFGIENMSQEEAEQRIEEFLRAEPELSQIPASTQMDKLRVRHGGYDVKGAQADHNVVFPLEPLRSLEKRGTIGKLADIAYSFVGACSQIRLRDKTGPQWVSLLKKRAVDVILLVPV